MAEVLYVRPYQVLSLDLCGWEGRKTRSAPDIWRPFCVAKERLANVSSSGLDDAAGECRKAAHSDHGERRFQSDLAAR